VCRDQQRPRTSLPRFGIARLVVGVEPVAGEMGGRISDALLRAGSRSRRHGGILDLREQVPPGFSGRNRRAVSLGEDQLLARLMLEGIE